MEQERAEGAASALAAHLQGIVKKRLHKLEQCSKPSSTEDPVEAVHDLRVASRRLRALGAVFSTVLGAKAHLRLEKKLKRVTRAAGAVRDWDVQSQLLDTRARRTSSELERACLEHLLESFVPERRRASKKAEARLRKVDVGALSSAVLSSLGEINARLSSGAAQREYAERQLSLLVSNAAELVPPDDGAEHAAELHRLRISLKELRYALELFEPLLGSAYAPLYERASSLQELLGAHHDLAVLGELVEKRGVELAGRQRAALASGMKGLGEALAAERLALAARFREAGFQTDWWRETLKRAFEAR